MAVCKCKNQRCACYLAGGFGTEMSGNGTERNPYRPERVAWELAGGETSSATVNITGNGTLGDPWVVEVVSEGASVTQSAFTGIGLDSWQKPPNGAIAHVVCIGGGGGGGNQNNSAHQIGGVGGAGGSMSTGWFLLADLPDSVDVHVGEGGAGAWYGSTNSGDWGGHSWFGEYLLANGGRGGTQAFPTPKTLTPGGTPPEGGPGGYGGGLENAGPFSALDQRTNIAPGGGGYGRGFVTPPAGAEGQVLTSHIIAGNGGRGAQSFENGLAGQLYGGGGGGSYVSTTAPRFTSGGDGAQGIVLVTVW